MSIKTRYLNRLIETQIFGLKKLVIKNIDNTPILKLNDPRMVNEETCLFHHEVSSGDDYFQLLHGEITQRLLDHQSMPVVRFADGEYAFYRESLNCNGLYQQAESVETIRRAMPEHIKALKILATSGKLAPLIHPGNIREKQKGFFTLFRKSKDDDSALEFLDFLFDHDIELTSNNYIPFYVVYAYLTSSDFGNLVDKKKICIINSECNLESCSRWFAQFSSRPHITFTEIPDSYMATRWELIRGNVLREIPSDTDLCIVGAGVGSLLVCADVAETFSIPAIDAGHVLNMLNGREDKSKGPRLYTIHERAINLK